jgi:hypothetical protein
MDRQKKRAIVAAVAEVLKEDGMRAAINTELTRQVSAKLTDLFGRIRVEDIIEQIVVRRIGGSGQDLSLQVHSAINKAVLDQVTKRLRNVKISFEEV